jgi:malate dehydrogenase (oxaloacetate-decarboxylating)(NADP+)
LPPRVFNMPLQKERFLLALRSEESTIRKHLMLEDLHDRNETLYHRVLVSISCFICSPNFHTKHNLKDT